MEVSWEMGKVLQSVLKDAGFFFLSKGIDSLSLEGCLCLLGVDITSMAVRPPDIDAFN